MASGDFTKGRQLYAKMEGVFATAGHISLFLSFVPPLSSSLTEGT